jgi:hypothetical protein
LIGETIDRQEAIELFHRLMQVGGGLRVLRLEGEAKMGKTHLMTQVYQQLAQQEYGACCVLLDLRSPGQTPLDLLYDVCDLGGGRDAFPGYHAAYEKWMNRPKVQVSGLRALFARVDVRSPDQEDETQRITRSLVSEFVEDLRALSDTPTLLLFDAVERASESLQRWLTDVFLVRLCSLSHVRIVVAGRSVPDPCASYAHVCQSCRLQPVRDEEAYISFCRDTNVLLEDQSIRDIARVLDYKPGMFVDYVVPKFRSREVAYG